MSNGQEVFLVTSDGPERQRVVNGELRMWAPSFESTATCVDEAGNETVVTADIALGPPGRE